MRACDKEEEEGEGDIQNIKRPKSSRFTTSFLIKILSVISRLSSQTIYEFLQADPKGWWP